MTAVHGNSPRLQRTLRGWADGWNRIGLQAKFYGYTLKGIFDAFLYYKTEIVRLIAQMGLGAGALAVIGGTIAIVGFLTLSTGALVAVQGTTSSPPSASRRSPASPPPSSTSASSPR